MTVQDQKRDVKDYMNHQAKGFFNLAQQQSQNVTQAATQQENKTETKPKVEAKKAEVKA